ncbi:MAG: hypothetical protein H5U13_09060 [Parvibaculum sp.]|nr:hypothetical protein [Parvibaculum sp.]
MKLRISLMILVAVAGYAAPAAAYVGPGAGLSVVSALIGVLLAVGAAIVFVIGWPIRRMLRRRKLAATRRLAQQETRSSSMQ